MPSKQTRSSGGSAPTAGRAVLRMVLALLMGLLLLAGVGAAGAYWWLNQPLDLRSATVQVDVEPGDSPRAVAQRLADAGVGAPAPLLYQWFRWSGDARRIRAGSYEFMPGLTPQTLLQKLVDGDETLARVRLIEGWTLRQVRAALASAPALKPDSAALSEAALMQAVGAEGSSAEGRFYPDTYTYARGSSDLAVLQRAHAAMQRRLAAAWAQRHPDLPLQAPEQALTLASIVEKETGRAADRAQIAGVFINRLRLGMPLQTDPTVIYGLGPAFDGNLRRVDLQTDTPYNTYTRTGLPPTPIAMPGRDALLAAVQPATTRALYFVARGDGSSEFSATLAEHNRAVNKFQRRTTTP